MIFITVGTTKFPFKRLDSLLEKLVEKFPDEEFVYQSATSMLTTSKNLTVCTELGWKAFIRMIKKARVVITHGGPATIFQILTHSKTKPIVIPRYQKFGEHVNNHQVDFIRFLAKKNIINAFYPEDSDLELFNLVKKPAKVNVLTTKHEPNSLINNLISFVERS